MKHGVIVLLITIIFSCKNTNQEKEMKDYFQGVSNTFMEKVEPPHWWVGMKEKSLQLLVYKENIENYSVEINYPGVTVTGVHKARSSNYLFIDLDISEETRNGKFDIVFKNGEEKKYHTYELKSRIKSPDVFVGFDSSDAIFLLTPDRFSNGDPSNDIDTSLYETHIDRSDDYARHGGDIRGIINHIDYIHDLGYTAVWPTPLLINDMPRSSYHGYAITDYYRVDPRFGTLDEYIELAHELQKKGMKLIMDQVANHCGLEHWWMKDIPFGDWVNNQTNYEANIDNWGNETTINSNHRRTTNQDIYSSEADRVGNSDGWFVPDMPDLNQRNPFMAKYIVQNSIWWIETLNLGGIRQDTYPYPDKYFMANWAGAIMNEYPNFSIVGEEWSYNPLLVAYWQTGNNNKDGYESNLKSSMDFPMLKTIIDGVNEEETWGTGLIRIYEGLANDFHYVKPKDIMVFLDNHDKSRIYTEMGGDLEKTKMALSYMLAMPRIPQVYYGTEILMDDFEKPGDHGLVRTDFPGGWEGDLVNAFTGEGLSEEQKDMQLFMTKLLNYRKTSKAIHEGQTVHFAPFMGTYFLFRLIEDETVAVILNKNDKPITLDLKRYAEMGLDGKTVKDIITGDSILWGEDITLSKKGVMILTTKE
jgi:glycosidase